MDFGGRHLRKERTKTNKQTMQLVRGKGMPGGYDWKKNVQGRGGEEHGTSLTLDVKDESHGRSQIHKVILINY